MQRSNAKTLVLLVSAAAVLALAVFVLLDFSGDTGPIVAVANSELAFDARSVSKPLELDNACGGRSDDSPDPGEEMPPPENSEPKGNTPPVVTDTDPPGQPAWTPIEQLPDLNHELYIAPRWSDDLPPQTAPEGYDENYFIFAESAQWRISGPNYHPRTAFDDAVYIGIFFLQDAPGESTSEKAIEWVEVRSSLTGQGWRLAPQPKKGRKYSRLEIAVPLPRNDVLVVRAKQVGGGLGEALVTRMGLGSGNLFQRQQLNSGGHVSLHLEPLDKLESYTSCAAKVADASGSPIADAMILYGSNVLGRTDGAGRCEFKLPEPRTGMGRVHPNVIAIWKSGYVPLFLDRSEIEAADWNLSVSLKAKELLVSIPSLEVPGECLLRDNPSRIMTAGNDLIPVPDDLELDWDSFLAALKGRSGLELPKDVAFGDSPWDSKLGFPQGLERALGTKRRDHWPRTYGCWYHNRWQYKGGAYEVCLPYAGKFVLLLGEKEGGHELTHVLFIDALDPTHVTGKLLVRPGY